MKKIKSTRVSSIQEPYLSVRGVCYDLSVTPYHKTIYYGADSIEYRFSSAFNRDRFINTYTSIRKDLSVKLIKKLNFNIDFDKIIDVSTYSKYEKRGF